MYPGLATTRSIGDLVTHQIGMKSEPTIKSQLIESTDKFMVLGSSSLFYNLPIPVIIEKISEVNIG